MKKLLIATMAAVSVGLCAKAEDTGVISETSFEGLEAGSDFNFEENKNYWQKSAGEDDLFKIIDVVYPQDATPQHWDLTTGEKALSIDTANPILRNVNEQSDTDNSYPAQAVTTPVFFDSVVQFTATDVAPSLEGNTTDKLMVWLYASPEDTEGRLFGEDDAITNLVITAGYYDNVGNKVSTNYLTNVSIQPDTWHRLTIKAINDIGIHNLPTPGFEVYVDGNKNPVSGKCDYDGENPTLVTKFPSLIARNISGVNYLQGVAFDGKGAVDDIVFTTTEPAFTKGNVFNVVISTPTNAEIIGVMDSNDENTSFAVGEDGKYSVPVGTTSIIVAVTYAGTITNAGAEPIEEGTWAIPVDVSSAVAGDTIQVEITAANTVVTYPTVKPNGDSTTQETLSTSAAAAIKAALEGVETMPDALTVIVNEKEYFGDEAVAKINEVVAMFKAAKEGETLKFFNNKGEMIVSFKAKNPLMETETAEATDYEAMVGESAATVTSDYTVNKETVDLTPGVAGKNEAVTFKLVIKPVSSTGSDTGSAVQE